MLVIAPLSMPRSSTSTSAARPSANVGIEPRLMARRRVRS
jgi:hypothetical protein